jgi:hypothetical protein
MDVKQPGDDRVGHVLAQVLLDDLFLAGELGLFGEAAFRPAQF